MHIVYLPTFFRSPLLLFSMFATAFGGEKPRSVLNYFIFFKKSVLVLLSAQFMELSVSVSTINFIALFFSLVSWYPVI